MQIGVTSWGPETMNGACGEKFLPDVYMRVAAFTAFINQKKPVIEPFLKRPRSQGFGSAASKVVGNPQVGRTVTCKVTAKLAAIPPSCRTPGHVRQHHHGHPGATQQTFKITRSVFRQPAQAGPARGLYGDGPQRGRQPSMPSGSVHLKNRPLDPDTKG